MHNKIKWGEIPEYHHINCIFFKNKGRVHSGNQNTYQPKKIPSS